MKTFELKNYENNIDKLAAAMATELGGELASAKVTGRFGDGSIVSIVPSVSNLGYGFGAYIEYPTTVKYILLNVAVKSGAVQLEEEALEIFEAYAEQLAEAVKENEEFQRLKNEELKLLKKMAEEAEAERIKQAKAKEKYEHYVHTTMSKLEDLPKNKMTLGTSFYGALGWLVNNMTCVAAAMPDFAEKWFRSIFGDVKARVVDQSKRSPAGWISQWGLSLTVSLKKSAKGNIPLVLREYTDRNQASQIADTRLVYTLLTDYGFKIGKKQDVDEIRRYIPSQYIADFEAGLAA